MLSHDGDGRMALSAGPARAESVGLVRGLRLLMVADSSSTHTHRWAQWFCTRGAKVTVLSGSPEPIDGASVVPFPECPKWYHHLPKARVLLDYLPFHQIIRKTDPQIIHVHFISEGGRAFYWDRLDVPMIASSWGQDVIFDNGPHRGAEASLRRILSRCQFITATTHQLAAATARYAPRGRPIYVIPFGVDLNRFTVRPEGRCDRVVLGFVKHLLPKYGPDVLIEAFSLIHRQRPHARLVLAGRGDMRQALERRVAELGLTDVVEFLGRVPHEKVPELIRSLDIMVMPSVYESETFGVAAIEASASGVPVVASRVGGVPEAVIDEQTGLLVPPRDVQALATACVRLIDAPHMRRCLGLAGRRFVERYYVWQNNALQMEEIYGAALTRRAPRDVSIYWPGVAPDLTVPA